MARYYILAKGNNALLSSGEAIWSHDISLCFEPVQNPVGFAEDIGHGGSGNLFTANEALGDQWRQHFVTAGGEWLLPFIEQIANGSAVDEAEVLRQYRARHGYAAGSFEAPFRPAP
jgi:hypothetical protein